MYYAMTEDKIKGLLRERTIHLRHNRESNAIWNHLRLDDKPMGAIQLRIKMATT